MVLFGTLDLGASVGGAELTYTPDAFQIVVDQAIMPVRAWHVKEEITFAVMLVQYQMNLMAAAFSYATTGVTTTVAGTLPTATAPTVTPQGTPGSTTYTYEVVAFNSNGDGIPSTTGTTATGAATLTAVNFNKLTWASVAGAAGYKIVRTVGGASQGLIATINAPLQLTLNDTGLVATPYTAQIANPATPNVDQLLFGGTVVMQQGSFDFSVPKNDGTSLHLRGHLNQVVSYKAIKLDYKREKNTDVSKVELLTLADTTQPAGQQAGYLIEEY